MDFVEYIVDLLCQESSNLASCVDWVMLLQAIVWFHKLARRHAVNSQMVSGLLAKRPESMNYMGPDAQPLSPYEVLSGKVSLGEVAFHIAIVETHVMTCQGKAEACEVRSQALMSYEQSILVLLQTIDILEHDAILRRLRCTVTAYGVAAQMRVG